MKKGIDQVHAFWEKQAERGDQSGSQDMILDTLEQRIFEKFLPSNTRLLEIGCGDGRNTIKIFQKYQKKNLYIENI